jgi:hypothetical protein
VVPLHYGLCRSLAGARGIDPAQLPWSSIQRIIGYGVVARLAVNFSPGGRKIEIEPGALAILAGALGLVNSVTAALVNNGSTSVAARISPPLSGSRKRAG